MWSRIFRIKAYYNGLTSLLLFALFAVAPDWVSNELFFGQPFSRIFLHLFLALAFVFGVGYWIVSHDPSRNPEVIRLGVLGQLAVFVITLYHTIQQNVSPVLGFGVGLIDLIFAILFLVFLSQQKTLGNTHTL